MFRAIFLILGGNASASILLLVRNLLVARLIPVEDYGVAATFAVTMAFVEMISNLGLNQQIIQSRDGDDPHFQAAVQGFQVLRGVLAGLVLVALAGPLARFLGVPEVAWAYRLMALVPVLNAAQHFDIHRLNRQMRFWPVVLTAALPALVSLIAVWPLSRWFGDWQVMLYAILLQAGLAVLVSQMLAERRYRLALDPAIIRRNLRFGWPLLINGLLLFFVFHGEKLVVGREAGMAPLAIFAMGITLTLTPTLVAATSAQKFFLPQLSAVRPGAAQENPALFATLAQATMQTSLLTGAVLVLGVLALGPPLVIWGLGEKYADLVALLPAFAVLHALRVYKAGVGIIGLARAQADLMLYANAFRVLALPVSWWVLARGGGLAEVIWIAILAEALGFALSMALLRWRLEVPLGPLWLCSGLSLALLAASLPLWSLKPVWLWGLLAVLSAALLVALRDLRGYLGRGQVQSISDDHR